MIRITPLLKIFRSNEQPTAEEEKNREIPIFCFHKVATMRNIF